MKKYNISYIGIAILLLLTPFAVQAFFHDPTYSLIQRIGDWVSLATPVVAGIALLVFFWGLVRFIWHGGDEEKRKEGKKLMGWGIVALFVIIAIWGIVFFIADSLDVGLGGSLPTPCVIDPLTGVCI